MKKTLKYGFRRRPQKHFQFVLNISSSWLESSYIPIISLLACLILKMAMKKTFKSGFGRQHRHDSNCFLIISSI